MKIIVLFLLLLSNCNLIYGQTTRERKVGENGFVWYEVKSGNLYGAEDAKGKTIIPTKYKSVDYVDNLGYRDYFIVDDPILKAEVTGSNGLMREFQGVYTSKGECIIPTSRGYSGIWGHKTENNLLYYSFDIHFNGVEIEGICNVHGEELWSESYTPESYSIKYSKYNGFYKQSQTTGENTFLNIKLNSNDLSFTTHAIDCITPSFEERIKTTPKAIETLPNGTIRKYHKENNNFRWYECRDKNGNVWAENLDGFIVVPPRYLCVIAFHCSNLIDGFFERRILDDGNYRIEAYTKEGNLLIPNTRNYWSIELELDDKFITVGSKSGIGICDFNGHEVVAPIYKSFRYDGYDFEGTRKSDRRRIKLTIHKRPSRKQEQKIRNSNGYYCNTPWLMMAGPQYTPTIDYWSIPTSNWNTMPIFGGVGDYIPTYSTDPCVNAAIISANSTRRLIQQGVNLGNTNSSVTTSSTLKCNYCNGTGRKAVDQSVATFGLSDPMVHCNECGRNYHRSTGHSHVTCGQCGGRGYQR